MGDDVRSTYYWCTITNMTNKKKELNGRPMIAYTYIDVYKNVNSAACCLHLAKCYWTVIEFHFQKWNQRIRIDCLSLYWFVLCIVYITWECMQHADEKKKYFYLLLLLFFLFLFHSKREEEVKYWKIRTIDSMQ